MGMALVRKMIDYKEIIPGSNHFFHVQFGKVQKNLFIRHTEK